MRKGWVYAAALLVAGSAGWLANGWRMGERMEHQRAGHIDLLRRTAEANARIILQQQADHEAQSQREAELDQRHTQELSHAIEENRRLEGLYSRADDERRRLRIEVRVARNDATVSETIGGGSVVDAAPLELSADSGRSIWDIRRGMIEDRAKLEYLQGYVRSLGGE